MKILSKRCIMTPFSNRQIVLLFVNYRMKLTAFSKSRHGRKKSNMKGLEGDAPKSQILRRRKPINITFNCLIGLGV